MTTILLTIGGGVIAFIFARSLFIMLFSMQNHGTHKERMKQLRKVDSDEKEVDSSAKLIDTITKPIIEHLLPKLKPKDDEQLEKDLKIAGWDNIMNPAQFRAMNILLKVTGVVAFIAVYPIAGFVFAAIFFFLFFFLYGFLFKNSIKEKKKALFNQFPDFIRIIQGYLMAGIPLTKAIEETIPYVGDDWKPVLKDFLLNCNIYSVPDAIDTLCNDVDIFEIREFFSLIKLNLEQGINIKESFESQSQKVGEMQLEVMLDKIEKRQMMAKVISAPLLLCMFASAGLPTFYSMMTFSTM